jgi:hypothetical protein
MEAFVGLLPTVDTFARFYNLRINSIQDKKLPNPKPIVQCGRVYLRPTKGAPFINFPAWNPADPGSKLYFTLGTSAPPISSTCRHMLPAPPPEPTGNIIRGTATWRLTGLSGTYMKELNDNTDISSDDIVRAFCPYNAALTR